MGATAGDSPRAGGEAALLRIGDVAQLTGLTVRAIRLYEEEGLLRPSLHVRGASRLYDAGDLARLRQIAALRDVGFSIAEIRGLLEEDALRQQLRERYLAAADPAERRRLLAEARLIAEHRLAALQRRAERLRALVEEEQARLRSYEQRLATLDGPARRPDG